MDMYGHIRRPRTSIPESTLKAHIYSTWALNLTYKHRYSFYHYDIPPERC